MSEDSIQAYAQAFKPTIWHRLGFGHAHVAPWDEPDKEDDDHYVMTDIVVTVDWKDRLRLLLTGLLSVAVRVKTEHEAGRCEGRSHVKVMGWGWHWGAHR